MCILTPLKHIMVVIFYTIFYYVLFHFLQKFSDPSPLENWNPPTQRPLKNKNLLTLPNRFFPSIRTPAPPPPPICRVNVNDIQGSIYLFKVDNGNTRAMCEICSKLTILKVMRLSEETYFNSNSTQTQRDLQFLYC